MEMGNAFRFHDMCTQSIITQQKFVKYNKPIMTLLVTIVISPL